MSALVVKGAREHNLKNISLSIPKHAITVVTGRSGSGKSSLVFSTIAAESQRLINETYPAFLQGFMPNLDRPDYDALEGLTCAIVVDQERFGANVRSTVSTVCDAGALLRVLFCKLAQPALGSTDAYSYNVPTAEGHGSLVRGGERVVKHFHVTGGMCLTCQGSGKVPSIRLEAIVDRGKSLEDGALLVPGYAPGSWSWRTYADSGLYPKDKPVKDFTPQELHDLLYAEPTKVKIADINMSYEGLINKLKKGVFAKDRASLQPHMRAFVEAAAQEEECPDCHGTRFSELTRSSKITGADGCARSIDEVMALEISELPAWIESVQAVWARNSAHAAPAAGAGARSAGRDAGRDGVPDVTPICQALLALSGHLIDVGLGYLTLSRASSTLSGGEAQRLKLVKHLGSALTDVTYIFDEPTQGMHPHDVGRIAKLLVELRDKGNTVLIVEHKPEIMALADHIVDLGPGAGEAGGSICFEGTYEDLMRADTATARSLRCPHVLGRAGEGAHPRRPQGFSNIKHATMHNLKDVSVAIPQKVFCVVTGVAGSGKSTLVHNFVARALPDCAVVDQSPIRGNRRSSVATYSGMADHVRKAFAKKTGQKPALFSANSEGACPVCKGAGVIETQLGFMDVITTRCEHCQGSGFSDEALVHTVAGKSIADIYDMSAAQEAEFFASKDFKVLKAQTIAEQLCQVGLGYMHLNQAVSTLSGGERQRLKLATLIDEEAQSIILDEPTHGLHMEDVALLLNYLNTLVDAGKSLIVIEHNMAVVAAADYVIDLGPEGGSAGGDVLFSGTPAEMVAWGRQEDGARSAASFTAKALVDWLEQK
ncbi:MAG: ATP-binding cassette domain-containing protein [Atopobiaceae bacterium]